MRRDYIMRLFSEQAVKRSRTRNGLEEITQRKIVNAQALSAKPISVQTDIPNDLELSSVEDARQFSVVLSELLTNAVKYHDPEKDKRLIRVAWNDDQQLLVVEDNGTGIEDIQAVWELGVREAARHPQVEGTGLGLTDVKRRLESISANISLESTVGLGTRFTIKFKDGSIVHRKMKEQQLGPVNQTKPLETASSTTPNRFINSPKMRALARIHLMKSRPIR
jgi:signal transduction histidine kinase